MDENSLIYHGPATRGTKSLSLLSASKAPANLSSDMRYYEFLNQNVRIIKASCNNNNNIYSCLYQPGHEKMCLMSYANNKGADQPAHPRSLISAFAVRCLASIISLDSIAVISRL